MYVPQVLRYTRTGGQLKVLPISPRIHIILDARNRPRGFIYCGPVSNIEMLCSNCVFLHCTIDNKCQSNATLGNALAGIDSLYHRQGE